MQPRYFLASNSGHATKTYLKLLQTVEAESITAIQPTSRPRKIELGSVELTIFPQAARGPQGGEQQLGRHPPEVRDILGPPARGQREPRAAMVAADTTPNSSGTARSSSWPITAAAMGPTARWLEPVRPELAVASMGRNNEFGHPHPETLSLLRASGSPCSAPTSSARSHWRATAGPGAWSARHWPGAAARPRPTSTGSRPPRGDDCRGGRVAPTPATR